MDSLPIKDGISKETLDSLDESILNTKNACVETEQQLEIEDTDEEARNALIFQLQKQRLDYARLHVKKVALLRKLVDSDADQVTFSPHHRGQHTFSNHAESSTNVWPDKRGTSQRTTTYSVKVRRVSGEEQIQQSGELRTETEPESDPFKAPIRGIDTDQSTSYEDIPASTRYTQPSNICDTLENALSFFQRSTTNATKSSSPGRTSPFDHLEETNIGTKVDEVILLGSGPDGPSASSTLERKERIIDQRQIVDQQVHFIHEHIKSYRLETVLSLAEAQLLSELGGLQVAKELGKMASTKTLSTDLDVFEPITPLQSNETSILWNTTDLGVGKLGGGMLRTSSDTKEDSGIKACQPKYGAEQQEEGMSYLTESKEPEAEHPSLVSQKIVTRADLLSEQNEQLLQTKISPTPKPRSRTPVNYISGVQEEDTSKGDSPLDTALFKEESIRAGQLDTTQIERLNELREEPEIVAHPISKEPLANFESAQTSLVKHPEEHLGEESDKISSSSAETVVTVSEQSVVKLEPCPVAHSLRDTLAEVTRIYPEEEIGTYDEGELESASKDVREGKQIKTEDEGFKELLEVVKPQDLAPTPTVALKLAIEEEIIDMPEEVAAISIQEEKIRGMPKSEKTGRIRKMAEEMERKSEKGMLKEPKGKQADTGKTKAMAGKFEDTIQLQRPEILKRSKDVKTTPLEFTTEQPGKESLEALPEKQERMEEIISDEIKTIASDNEEKESTKTDKPDTSLEISGLDKEDTTEESLELLKEIAEPDTYLQEGLHETSRTPETVHMEQDEDNNEDLPVLSLEEKIQAKQLSALQKYKIKNREKYEAEQEEKPIKFSEMLESEKIKQSTVQFDHSSTQMLQKEHGIVTGLLETEIVPERFHLLGQLEETAQFKKTAEKIDAKFKEPKVESEIRRFTTEIIQEKQAEEMSDFAPESKPSEMEALELKDRKLQTPFERPMSVEDSEIITILQAESPMMRKRFEETTEHQKIEDEHWHMTVESSSNIEDTEAVKLQRSGEQSTTMLSGTFTEIPLTSDLSQPPPLQLLLYITDLEDKPLSAIQKYHLAQHAANAEKSKADEPKRGQEELGRIRKMAKEIQEAAQNIEQEKPVPGSEKDSEVETRIRETQARQAVGKGREASRTVHGVGKIKNIAQKMETLAQAASGQYEVLRRQRDLKPLPIVSEQTQERQVQDRSTLLTGSSEEVFEIEPVEKPELSQKHGQSSQSLDREEFDFEDVKDMADELKTLEITEDSSSSYYSSDEPMLPEELDNLVQSIVSTSKSPASRTKSAPKERSTIAKQRTFDTKVEQSSESKAHDEKLPPSTRSEVPAQITSESASTDQSEVKPKPMLQVIEEQSLKVTYEIEEISDKKRLKRLPTTEPKEEQSYEDQTLDESSQTQCEVHENVLEKEEPADKPKEMARIVEEESLKMTSEIEEISNTKKIKKTPKVPPEEEQGYEDLIVEQSAPTDNEIHEVNETEGGSKPKTDPKFEKEESTLKLEKVTAETLQLLLFLEDLAYVPLSPLQKYHLEAFEKKIREDDKEEKLSQKVLAQKEMGKIRQMTDQFESKIECIKECTQDKDKGESSEEGTGRIRQMAEEIQKKQLTESVSQAKDVSSIEWKKSEESGKIRALAGKFQDIAQKQQYEVLKRSKELRKMPLVFTRSHKNEPAPSTSEYELAEKMPQKEVVQTSKEIESSSANVTESAEEQARTQGLAQSEISTFDMGSEDMLEKQESASNQPMEITSELHVESVAQEVESMDTEAMTAENERNILKEFEESQIKLTYKLEESTEHIRVRRTPTGEIIEEISIGPDTDSHLEVQNEPVELPDESESHDESLNILSRSVELTQQPLSNLQKFRLYRNIEKAGESPPSLLGAGTAKNDNVGRIKQMAEKVETEIQAMTGHYDVLQRTRDLKRTPLEIQMDAELIQSKISSETSLIGTMHEIPTSELLETEIVSNQTRPPLRTSQVEVEPFSERTDESMEAKFPDSKPGIWKTAEKVPIESEWERPPSRKSSAHMLGRLLSDIQEREDEDEQSLKRPESILSTLSEVVILHWLEPEPDMEYEPLEIMQPLHAIPQYVNKKFKLNDEEKPVSSQTALSRSGGIVQRLVEEYDETGIETVVEFVLEPNLDYENKHANAEDKFSPLSDSKEDQGKIEPNVTSPAEPSSHGFTPACEIQDTKLKTAERSHTAQRMSETVKEKSYDVINVMAPEGFQDLADITLSEGKADISYVTEEIPVYDSSMVQATLGSDEDKKETATGEVLAKETEVETQTFGTREIDTAILPEISRNTPTLPISQEEGPSEDELFRVDSRQLHYEEIFSQDLSTEFIPELAAELPSRKSTIGEADVEYHVENLEKEPELHSRNMTITFSSQIPLHPDLVEGASVLSLALETEEERNRKAVRDNLANEMMEGDTFVTHDLCRTLDLLPSILEIVPESQQRVNVRREQPYISTPVSTRDDHELEASQEIPTEPATFTTKTTATFVIRDKAKVDSIPMPDGSDTQQFEQNVLAADAQISVPGTSKASEIAPALITRRSFRRSVGVQANPLYSQVGMQTESGQSRTTNIETQSEVDSTDHIWAIQHSRAEDGRSSVDLEIHAEPFTASLSELRSYADAALQTDGYLTGIDDEHQLLHLHEEQRPSFECPSLKISVDTADYMVQTDMIQPALGNVIDVEISKELREQMSSSAVQTSPILMKDAKEEIELHPQEHFAQIDELQKQQRQKERSISESELERVRETLEAIRNIIHSPISDQQPPSVVEPQRRPLETLAEVQERSSQSLEIDFSSESESYAHKPEGKSSSEVEHDMEPAQHCDTLLKSADLEWLHVIPPRRTVDDNEKFLKDLEKAGIALDVSQHPNLKEVIEEELKAIRHRPTDNFRMTPERGEEFELVTDRETDEELLDGNENEASADIAHYFETKSLETPTVPQMTENEYPPEPLYRIDEEERSETSEERPKSISLDQKSDKSNEPHIPISNIQDFAESAEQTELIPGIHSKRQETREYTNTAIDTCRAPVKPRRSADLLLEKSQEIEEEPISVISSESKLGHDFREDQLRIIKYTLDAVNRHLQKDEITPEEPAEIVEEADLDLYYQDSVNLTDNRHPLDSGEFGLRMESRSPSLRLSPTNDNERLLQDIREARRLLGKGMREAKTHKSPITVPHRAADHWAIEAKERNRPMPLDFTTSNIVKDYDVIHERLQLQPPPFSMRRPSLPEYRPPSPVILMDLNNIPLLSPTSMHFHIFDQYLQQHNWQMPYFLVPKEHELLGHCKWPLIERVIPSFLEAAAEILMRSAHLATDRVIVIQTIDKTGRRSDFPRKFSKASEEVLSPPVPGSDYTVTQFQFTDPSDRPIRPKKRFNLYYEVDESFISEKDEDELEQWHKLYRERDEPIRSIKNEGPYADDLETETDLDENASVGSEEDSIIPKDSDALWTQPYKEKRNLADELKYIIIRSEPSENKSLRQYPEIIPEPLLIKGADKLSEYEYEFPIELDEPRKEESENKVNLPEVAFNPNEARFVIFRRSKRAKDPKYSMIESVPQKDTPEKVNQRRSPRHVLQETKIQTLPAQLVKLKPPAQIAKPPSPVDHRSETAIELAGVLARRLKRLEDIEHEKLQKGAQILPRQVPNTTDPPKAQTVSFHQPKEVESVETKKMSPFGGRKSFLKSGKLLQISDSFDDFDETMRSGQSEQSKQTSMQSEDYGQREKALEKRKPEDNTSQTDPSVASLPSRQPKAPSTQPEQIHFAHSHIQTLNPVSELESSRPTLKSVQLRQKPAKRKRKPEDSGAFNSDSESEQEDKYVRRASKLFRHLDKEYLSQKEKFAESGPRLYTIRFARPPILSIVGNRKHYIAMPELYDGLHNTNGTQSDNFGLNGKDESDQTRQWDPTTLLTTKLYKVDYNPLVEKRNRFRTMEGHLEVPNDETNIVPEIENAWKRLYFRTKDGRFQWFANHCADEHPTEDVLLTGTTITANKDEWTLEVKGGKENANITVRAPSNLFEKWRQALLSNSHSTIIDAYVQPVYPPVPHYTHKVVLIELGTCSVRAGILTNKPSLPQTFFPAVGCVTAAGEVFVGIDAFKPDIRSQGVLQSPIQTAEHQNLVERYKLNKVVLEACLRKVLTDLRVDPSQYKVLLSVPQNIPTVFICDLIRSLLRELRFKAASIARQPSLILYSYDVTTGVVVDIGERLNIVPVIDEYIVESAIISLPFGAQQIRDSLKKNLRERNSGTICSFSSAVEQIFLRHIMEQSCYVATDFEEEVKKASDVETTVSFDKFNIGSGMDSKFTVDASRFHATEGLFKPKRWGLEMKGIHQLIHDAIQQSPIDSRRTLYRNIYLTGGTSLLPGLAERLETELAKIAPSSIFVQVHGSPWRYHSGYLGSQIIANSFQFENCCADLNNLDEYIGQLEKSIN